MTLEDEEILDAGSIESVVQLSNYQIVGLYKNKKKFPKDVMEIVEAELNRRNLSTSEINEIEEQVNYLEPIESSILNSDYWNILIFMLAAQAFLVNVFVAILALIILLATFGGIITRFKYGARREKVFWLKLCLVVFGINILCLALLVFI